MNSPQTFSTPLQTVLETPRTASDVARELGKSITTIKELARRIHAPVLRTGSGIWLFPPAAVEKLRAEIERRRQDALRP
jgi:hypothetical protein